MVQTRYKNLYSLPGRRHTKPAGPNGIASLLGGIGAGAFLMFVLDPVRGRRRRALMRDQLVHLITKADDALAATGRDMANRARGVVAEMRAALSQDDVPDEVLEQRVRAKLGHYVSHPGSIDVMARDRCVILSGPVLAGEVDALLGRVRSIRGVREIDNQLEVHEQPGDVPGLQGGVERAGERFELFQSHWSPTARVLAATVGAVALLAGSRQPRGVLGTALGTLGLGMFARAVTNRETKHLIGVGGEAAHF